MKKIMVFFITALMLTFSQTVVAADFTIKSPQLSPGGRMAESQVLNGFGCNGQNISPKIQWQNAPIDAKSFAITVYDPDAPTGSGWWHWVVFNVPADVNELKENAGDPLAGIAPQGSVQSRTDFGKPGYGGACPPAGDNPHRYQFTVFALDVPKLPLNAEVSGAMVGFYLSKHTLSKTQLTVYYSR